MNNTDLKDLLKRLIERNENKRKANFERNKGLSGKSICTIEGKQNDSYYKGKIQAYQFILDKLESEEN